MQDDIVQAEESKILNDGSMIETREVWVMGE
jgi:hypothetical protein